MERFSQGTGRQDSALSPTQWRARVTVKLHLGAPLQGFVKILGRTGQLTVSGLVMGWVGLAIWFHAAGWGMYLLWAALAGFGLNLLYLAYRGRWGRVRLSTGLLLALAAGWFWSLTPRDDRDWAADVAHGVSAQINGSRVTLSNVRNFDWTSLTEARQSWETRVVDLDQISRVDLFSSVWDSPAIAHTLVSFGFSDGQQIVFSVEIRKEEGEEFSSLGGFFRRFELVIIAADEADIVHLRTDMRKEAVALYPIDLDTARTRQLFLNFVNRANALAAEPEWYNTLTTNCTTLPYQLVRGVAPDVTLDWRVVVSGHLADYLYELGVLRPDMALADIKAKARLPEFGPRGTGGKAYSHRLRAIWQ